ncbi:MAG: PaaI family thioesterase [Bacteroidales bacterium]|nr:PaaI family thioesterase [Bacteroidales bacterium]
MVKQYLSLEQLNKWSVGTMVELLGIEFTEVGSDYLIARMPVTEKLYQPNRIMHGGASLALAETVGGALSAVIIDPEKYAVRGITINANHVKAVRDGNVWAKATFIHKGTSTHVIEIRISNDSEQLVSVTRLTNFIAEHKQLNGK